MRTFIFIYYNKIRRKHSSVQIITSSFLFRKLVFVQLSLLFYLVKINILRLHKDLQKVIIAQYKKKCVFYVFITILNLVLFFDRLYLGNTICTPVARWPIRRSYPGRYHWARSWRPLRYERVSGSKTHPVAHRHGRYWYIVFTAGVSIPYFTSNSDFDTLLSRYQRFLHNKGF